MAGIGTTLLGMLIYGRPPSIVACPQSVPQDMANRFRAILSEFMNDCGPANDYHCGVNGDLLEWT